MLHENPHSSFLLEMDLTVCPESNYYYSYYYYCYYDVYESWVIIALMIRLLQMSANGSIFIVETKNFQDCFQHHNDYEL